MKITASISPEHLTHPELLDAFYCQQLEVEKLQRELSWLKKQIFGTKTDRFVSTLSNPSQLPLGIETEVVAACKITDAKKITYVKSGEQKSDPPLTHPGRMKLPSHLRREETVIEPAGDVTGLKKIGEDITEIMEYKPGELFIRKLIRPKYVQAGTNGVIMGNLPPRALPKHIFGDSLLAQTLIDKYIDHIPLNRQNERFKRQGVRTFPPLP